MVLLSGLETRADLNGRLAKPLVLLRNGRWSVKLLKGSDLVKFVTTGDYRHDIVASDAIMSVKMSNLALFEPDLLHDFFSPLPEDADSPED